MVRFLELDVAFPCCGEEQAGEGEVNQSRLGWLPGGGDARPVFIRVVYVSACAGVWVGMLRGLLEPLRMFNKRVRRLSLHKGHSGSSEEEPWEH